MRILFGIFCLHLISLPSLAEETNFRVGLGMLRYDISPAAEYMPNGKHTGITLMAEYPQDNIHGSRFIIYSLDDEGVNVWGVETQMLLGYGLAKPGFRIYTGPAWHREFIKLRRTNKTKTQLFNGWGWQLGFGWQLDRLTLDIAATYRDPKDYHSENKNAGVSKSPAPILGNALLSYQF